MNEYSVKTTGSQTVRLLLYKVFGWMAIAVGISGCTAAVVASKPEWTAVLMQHPFSLLVLFFLQLGLVIALSSGITKFSYTVARLLFVTYALVTGVTLSFIFLVYTTASITLVFFSAAAMFAVMAVYGYVTQRDLAAYASLLQMALFGIIIASLINIFLGSSSFEYLISILGVLLFSALTAFDIQNIQKMAAYLVDQDESFNKIALLGALQLYLDFLNLFLSLLRLFGKRRS